MFETFEQAVYSQLFNSEDVIKNLTTWNDLPAVFNTNFPPDSDSGWKHQKQFPRIVFYVDWSSVPDRLISGQLILFIQWHNDQFIETEIIESEIKRILSNVFFTTARGVFCCSWNTSESFTYEGNEQVVNGIRMEFNVLSFPDQNTYLKPDPIPGFENYIKEIDESFLIINKDQLPEIFIPEIPVIYVRSESITNAGVDTYAYRFMNAQIAVHVICVDYQLMRKTIGKIQQQAMLDGECWLENGNQFLITDAGNNLTINYLNNSLMDGQFTLTGRFAINAVEKAEGTVDKFIIKESMNYG